MAGIIFRDFIITKASYTKNYNFNIETEEVNAKTSFECEINENEDNAIVKLITQSGNLEDKSSPFQVNVEIEGLFEFVESESEGLRFEEYLTNNAVAILFPYIRSTISELTAKSNEFPVLNLPIINVARMLKEENKINHVYKNLIEED